MTFFIAGSPAPSASLPRHHGLCRPAQSGHRNGRARPWWRGWPGWRRRRGLRLRRSPRRPTCSGLLRQAIFHLNACEGVPTTFGNTHRFDDIFSTVGMPNRAHCCGLFLNNLQWLGKNVLDLHYHWYWLISSVVLQSVSPISCSVIRSICFTCTVLPSLYISCGCCSNK